MDFDVVLLSYRFLNFSKVFRFRKDPDPSWQNVPFWCRIRFHCSNVRMYAVHFLNKIVPLA